MSRELLESEFRVNYEQSVKDTLYQFAYAQSRPSATNDLSAIRVFYEMGVAALRETVTPDQALARVKEISEEMDWNLYADQYYKSKFEELSNLLP